MKPGAMKDCERAPGVLRKLARCWAARPTWRPNATRTDCNFRQLLKTKSNSIVLAWASQPICWSRVSTCHAVLVLGEMLAEVGRQELGHEMCGRELRTRCKERKRGFNSGIEENGKVDELACGKGVTEPVVWPTRSEEKPRHVRMAARTMMVAPVAPAKSTITPRSVMVKAMVIVTATKSVAASAGAGLRSKISSRALSEACSRRQSRASADWWRWRRW
eukprot:3439964-Pleurochrysis_carterae.AAC.1